MAGNGLVGSVVSVDGDLAAAETDMALPAIRAVAAS